MNDKYLKLDYLFEFLMNFKLTSAIWPVYLAFKGFSLLDIGISESIFHITSMLGEIPTGMISDLYGRKLSRILSRAFEFISVIFILFADSIWFIYFSFILSALSYNLESGTDSAYVFDLLKETGEQDKYSKVQGIREVIFQVAMLLGASIGGKIASQSYKLVYQLSLVVIGVSIIILLFMKEIKATDIKETSVLKNIKQQFQTSYQLIANSNQIRMLLLTYSLFSSTVTTCHFYLANYWQLLGIRIDYIAYFLAIENIAGMIAGAVSYRIIKRFNQRQLLVVLPLLIVIFLVGIPFFPISVFAICIMAFLESILYISISTYLNELVDSSHRATLLSCMSMMFSVVMIVYFPLVGWLGDTYSLKVAFMVLFVVNSLVYFVYYRFLRKQKDIR